MSSDRVAVVLMAYGSPRSHDEILPYYTDIRRGRAPTDEALDDLCRRYDAIGGLSPLARLTEQQRDAIQRTLDAIEPDRYEVVLGLKHSDPKIEATVDEVAARGCSKIVGVVLAPHFSAYSIGQYLDRVRAAAEPYGIEVAGIDSWAVEPAFIDFVVDDLRARLKRLPARTRVLFTAHSLPERIVLGGDRYIDELHATAEAVAERLDLVEGTDWQIAWQSAGRTPEPWIGPDILEVIDQLGTDGDVDAVVVSSVGFVADHLEVLYDLDIEAKDRAHRVGLTFDRTASVNDSPAVMAALAHRIHHAAS